MTFYVGTAVGLGFFPCPGSCGARRVAVLKTSERARKWRYQAHVLKRGGTRMCSRSGTNLDAVELLALLARRSRGRTT